MAETIDPGARRRAIDSLAVDANLPDVAEALGLRVFSRGGVTPRALCPFHSDQHPSLYLYPSSRGARAQFHCFACGAHGDVYDLIKKQLITDFRGALDWLSARYHFSVPEIVSAKRYAKAASRVRGLDLGFDIYRNQSSEEQALIRQWAVDRQFEPTLLDSAEVFAARPPKIATSHTATDREQFDALEDAGLLIRGSSTHGSESNLLPLELPARDFFDAPRIMFTIRDDRGAIAGFAGRALGTDSPKYLFSPRFPRASTLYRWHKVRNSPRTNLGGQGSVAHVFVVEGLMDALRLESVGLDAIAVLGSSLTNSQVQLLTDCARDFDRSDRQLAIHLMFDSDDAGRRGAINATVKLLDAAASNPGLLIDVIAPDTTKANGSDRRHDPDEIFRDIQDHDAAMRQIVEWCHPPMSVLLSAALDITPAELDSAWSRLPDSQRLRAFRDVERRLENRAKWLAVLDRVPAFERQLGETVEPAIWQEPLNGFLRATTLRSFVPIPELSSAVRDDNARLIRALQIAEASTQRREFPVDEGSWDRLQSAVDTTLTYLRDLLAVANDSNKLDAGPMLAVEVPKAGGKFRLKALPSPEILTLQQYVLDEILRDYAECPRFQGLIPGVRFSRSRTGRQIDTTGNELFLPKNGETVSFAYMLDMDVIEQRAAPRHTGMFRSYYDCWRDFIAHIDARVTEFPKGKYHVARLDIRRFYDTVPRSAVNTVLLRSVADALAELADSTTEPSGASKCAPLFLPTISKPLERAQVLVDWLCDQSFDYLIENPGTGHLDRGNHGLPQGPDLSAYLANISLFPLDRALSELVAELDEEARKEVGKTARGGVYARYVDDMVIIARTAHDLARLRGSVEKQLALLGMELNPKTDALPVMNEADVREWLTDRRGAGLGVSGPFDGPPVNAPLALLDPLADAGETDRSDSLLILYDPRLEDPDMSLDELENAISTVRSASDLRHGEQVASARHLWRCVLARDENITPETAALVMMELWKRDTPPFLDDDESSNDDLIVSDLLAWLDGIQRFLVRRPDRNPGFSEEKHHAILHERKRMAALVNGGLCEYLIERALPDSARARFAHMIDLKALANRCASSVVATPAILTSNNELKAGRSRAKARLLMSLAEAQKSPSLLDSAGWRAPDVALVMLFHESIARLRIANGHGRIEVDPLTPVSESLELWRQKELGKGPSLFRILELWMPESKAHASSGFAEIALGSLINLSPKRIIDLLERRLPLKSFALDNPDEPPCSLLPTPPAIDVPGVLGLRADDRVVCRADFRHDNEGHFSPSLSWTDTGGDGQGRWTRSEAVLGPFTYLAPRAEIVRDPRTPNWLAEAFRSLWQASQSATGEYCPPTAVNLLGPEFGIDTNLRRWGVLGFCTTKARLAGQAFLRHGLGGLALEPVLEQHDDLWRIGTALADWLGRAESSRTLSTQRLSTHALITEQGDDWAREAMLRFSLCRLRGLGLPTRPLRLSSETNLPITIERLLRRLEKFPSDYGSTGLTGFSHLVATLAEGRAIQTRINSRTDPETPGGAVALLIEMVRVQFRADEEFALRLPESELPIWSPVRRPARALIALSQRFELLADADPEGDQDPTVKWLACGARLLAVEANIRAQALELWSLVEPNIREKFVENPPDLTAWNLDTEVLLHNQQIELTERDDQQPEWRNVKGVFQQLQRATIEGQRVRWSALSGITPIGWLVILGALSGSLTGEWRGALPGGPAVDSEGFEGLSLLAAKLSLASDVDDDLPWGGFDAVMKGWTISETQRVFNILNRIDQVAKLIVKTFESTRFHIEGSRRGPTEVETSDGLRQLQGWTISWAKTIDENRTSIERVPAVSSEPRAVFRWSETWQGNRLLGIGVVQSAMTELAGKAFSNDRISLKKSSAEPSANLSTSESSSLISELSKPKVTTDPSSESEEPVTPQAAANGGDAPAVITGSTHEITRALSTLRTMQEDSWTSRHEKPESHARIALLQWEVDSSYRHPAFELCNSTPTGFDSKEPGKWTRSVMGQSCSEARRRAILKAALKACYRFSVDILLLPEYSTRPETVSWLASELPSLAPKTSVWAGTYRLPPWMSNTSVCPDWSAVHEIVLPDQSERRRARAKKYPSAAADEIFRPGDPPLAPLFGDERIGDVRSYMLELICSEVFLVTCPANIRPLARARRELLRKFGVRLASKDLESMINSDIMRDITEFARHTGVSEGLKLRRTILLVPAMTSRSTDYTILGQAAYLSSGLTTVFCNAVLPHYGNGKSCFIGHDCWQDTSGERGYPGYEPYHGERPGIFNLNHGQLGREEQALVIADIDPLYASEGKPRQQTLLKPLRLVAHLPLIESWQPKPGAIPSSCRCYRSQQSLSVAGFAPILLQALQRGSAKGWKETISDSDPAILTNALRLLADPPQCARQSDQTNAGWLRRRATAYLTGHAADPCPWPPPVALDWLWVDPDSERTSPYPSIDVPPYAAVDSTPSFTNSED
jgi:DNA primase catalytic core